VAPPAGRMDDAPSWLGARSLCHWRGRDLNSGLCACRAGAAPLAAVALELGPRPGRRACLGFPTWPWGLRPGCARALLVLRPSLCGDQRDTAGWWLSLQSV
jgi:hypothetical protein